MKRSALLTIFVVSLVLSRHAQCADAKSAKGPLTTAEIAQCTTLLTELNQNVNAYNAKVGEIKALEDEIDVLHAEIEKEKAAGDSLDNEAIQAINAKIGKNNELVEKQKNMVSSAKAMASESKQREAQFHETCENRPSGKPSTSKTPPSDSVCGSTTGVKDVQRQLDAAIDEMRADEKQHQAEVDRVAQQRAKAQSWSDEKRSKVWLQLASSPKFMAFEREKQPYVQELFHLAGNKPKNDQEECLQLQRIAATLPAIKAINARQYAFIADEIRAAK